MLDNFSAATAREAVSFLRAQGLWDSILTEISGRVTESTIGEYAGAGVDVISVGALTHSVRALDLSQTFE